MPGFRCWARAAGLMERLAGFLTPQFAAQQTMHGSLVDVYDVGLLLTGKSGIGESEVALDLVERGHRLVAGDVVLLTRRNDQILLGSGTDLDQHFMVGRGPGLTDIRSMTGGVRAIRFRKPVEVTVNMQQGDTKEEYTRPGKASEVQAIPGVDLSATGQGAHRAGQEYHPDLRSHSAEPFADAQWL